MEFDLLSCRDSVISRPHVSAQVGQLHTYPHQHIIIPCASHLHFTSSHHTPSPFISTPHLPPGTISHPYTHPTRPSHLHLTPHINTTHPHSSHQHPHTSPHICSYHHAYPMLTLHHIPCHNTPHLHTSDHLMLLHFTLYLHILTLHTSSSHLQTTYPHHMFTLCFLTPALHI